MQDALVIEKEVISDLAMSSANEAEHTTILETVFAEHTTILETVFVEHTHLAR